MSTWLDRTITNEELYQCLKNKIDTKSKTICGFCRFYLPGCSCNIFGQLKNIRVRHPKCIKIFGKS